MKTPQTPDDMRAAISKLVIKFEDYVECDEWHIHDDTNEHEGSTTKAEHIDYDAEKLVTDIDALLKQAIAAERARIEAALDDLYQPEITDLERNEYHSIEQPMVYLSSAKNALYGDVEQAINNQQSKG